MHIYLYKKYETTLHICHHNTFYRKINNNDKNRLRTFTLKTEIKYNAILMTFNSLLED